MGVWRSTMAKSEKVQNAMIIIGYVFKLTTIIMFVLGFVTMTAFMMEESLQAQMFSIAIPMMSKEWESAQACVNLQESYIRANISTLKWCSRLPWMVGFRAYAEATEMKLDGDKAFIRKMINQERQQELLAMRGVR